VSIAHLVAGQPTAAVLVDEGSTGQTVIDDAHAVSPQRTGPERHGGRG
jgi:hypothetical protein